MYVDGETEQGLLLSICNQHLLSALLVVPRGNITAVNVWAGQAHKLAKCCIMAWFESYKVGLGRQFPNFYLRRKG